MIVAILVLLTVYVVHGYLTFDITLSELKKTIGTRNEAQASNIMTDLDKFIEKRISDFRAITKVSQIQNVLKKSNQEFSESEDIEEFIKRKEIEFQENIPFISTVYDKNISSELLDLIRFYRDEYDYNVIEELFLTNAYGANVALGAGTSDYRQDDEEWWQIAKNQGLFVGELRYREEYQKYALALGYSITDEDGNFLGVMRVLVTIDDLLHGFVDDVEVLHSARKNVILLDQNGRAIYADGINTNPDYKPVDYFQKLTGESGFIEIGTDNKIELASYSKSIGYKDFAGFDWTVVLIQEQSAIIEEFVGLRNSIFVTLLLGAIASIIIGIIGSVAITRPLKQISIIAKKISSGDFDTKIRGGKIDEINVIIDSINKMGDSLKKLIETEKKLAEAHVKVKSERLTAMGELAASMAHDMKNPLATIRSSAEIVKRNAKGDDEEMKKVLSRMDRAIYRMAHQIEDVLNFVRITPLEMKNTSIVGIFNSVIESLEMPQNISIELPKNDVQVFCDPQKIEIVFINLILNAIQAIGDKKGKIVIRIKQESNFSIIEIEDSGPGIPKEYYTKIFEPLVTSKQKGTGLGLSTCKNIIEQHGGTISVSNNPTTFTIRLPTSYDSQTNDG